MTASLTARRQIHETYSGYRHRGPDSGSGAARSVRGRGPHGGAASSTARSATRVEIHRGARCDRAGAAEISEGAQLAWCYQDRCAEVRAAVGTRALAED